MVSLVYYLRVIAAMWMETGPAPVVPALAGGAPEATVVAPASRSTAVPVAIAVVAGAATVLFGILPDPLLDLAADAGSALL